MSGLFGVVSQKNCSDVLFYGTDYHSHLGTERGGMAVLGDRFYRSIHDITQGQFKSKFVNDYKEMKGDSGIGVISDRDDQPLLFTSRFGTFAIATAGLIDNVNELSEELLKRGESFVEMVNLGINSTELVAKLITQGDNLIDGIEKMFDRITRGVLPSLSRAA
jgi:amidophosphoribosyltransferase